MDDPATGLVLAIDLGGTQIRAAAVADDGSVRHRTSTRTPVDRGAEVIVTACIETARTVLERAAAAGDGPLIGVGISSPGPVDPFQGVVTDPPNLGPTFRGIPLAQRVEETLCLPTFLDRDTQVAAMGEGAFGAAVGCRDFIYLTVSTGIGGAIVSDGRLLRGPDGTAGEVGHLLVDRSGPLCGCGAAGHLEAIASGTGIARAARLAVERGHGQGLATLVASAGEEFGAREVVAAAQDGDPVASAIIDDAVDAFALSCVTLVDVFDPELLLVGGSLAWGLGDRLLAPARDAVARWAFRAPGRRVRIALTELGDDVGLVGAWELVRERMAVPEALAT